MFYRAKEVGKTISADNLKKIQNIHDATGDLGAACGASLGLGGGIYESARYLEAALPMNTSHDALRGHIRKALQKAHGATDSYYSDGPYVSSDGVFPEHVVYSYKGNTYARKYSVKNGAAGADPEVTLGTHKKVHMAYVDSKDDTKESMSIHCSAPDMVENWEDYKKLQESGGVKSVTVTGDTDGTVVRESVTESISDFVVARESATKSGTSLKSLPIKVMHAGWGSSAFYPKDVLMRDGPTAFPAGTKMFWNHATEAEDMQRPEGNLDNMAAVTTEAAQWDDNGAKGPGLYAKSKVFSDYATQVAEKGPHIGVSINTFVKGKEGEMEGKRGRIAEKLLCTKLTSIDFVTTAGAGGAPIVHATESHRAQKETDMTDQERTEMESLRAENARLKESDNRVVAVATVGSILREAGIQYTSKVLERACQNPTIKDGMVDADWVKSVVEDFSDGQTGRVVGMGRESYRQEVPVKKQEEQDKRMKEAFKVLGVPEAGLDYAVNFGKEEEY